jgi:ParB family chromosome partitioning protein
MLEMAIVENIQRENLNAMEVALSLKRLAEECNLTQEQLSERVAKKRSTITNYLRLLKLPAEIQAAIRENKISMGHAKALINVPTEERQLKILERILKEDLSVRAVEEMVKSDKDEPAKKNKKGDSSPDEHFKFAGHIEKLVDYFQAHVEIREGKKGDGRISISYADADDLQRILSLLEK